MVEPVYRLLKAMRNYRNPLSVGFQRIRGASTIKVADRRTGLSFLCRPGADQMMPETFHARIYDIPFVPIRPGDVVIDIGANHGFYSCLAATQGAIVHAFEPDPNTYSLLVGNIKRNGLEGKVIPHQCAIAAESGESPMYCTADLGGGKSTIVPAFAVKSGMEVTAQSKVQTMSMADALDHCGVNQVRVCKIDCEGAEHSILSGLDCDIIRRFDAFVLEYHAEAYRLDQFMEMLIGWDGYQLSKVVGQDRDLGNANLSIVSDHAIRQWCARAPVAETRERIIEPTEVAKTTPIKEHAVA
jgi:FkbM family methyltransferase